MCAVLETERLRIREFRDSDRAAVREYTSDEATMAAYPPRGRSMTLAPPTGGSAWSAAQADSFLDQALATQWMGTSRSRSVSSTPHISWSSFGERISKPCG